MTAARFGRPRRIVVKVGSTALGAASGALDVSYCNALVAQLSTAKAGGTEVVLVSSGAVAAGLAPLGFDRRPSELPDLQAAASVGQGILVHTYQAAFAGRGLASGQVLLTVEDVVDRTRYLNARNTFDRLLALGAVPVVNENDTVATEGVAFGDNDRLAALVASMLGAELLVLLSDVEGLLDGDPSDGADLALIDRVDDWSLLTEQHFGPSGSTFGRGGMATKLEAARIAIFSGVHAVIAAARRPGVIADVIDGAAVGTWFVPSRRRPSRRKLWIAFARTPRGRVVVDRGAVRALTHTGSSLLAAGVLDATGDFAPGDGVEVVGPDARVIARGLVAYGRDDVLTVRGRSTEELAKALGPRFERAVIHRDSLVVLA